MLTELNIGNSTQTRPYSGLDTRWMKKLHFHSLKSSKNLDPTYVVNVYSDMSLSKGHLGSRGAKHLKIN